MTKFIFVTGSIISGLGKGVTTSSLASLFQLRGFKISIAKIDPYLNMDSGTIEPKSHGECYVLDDGSEVDLDLGNYERFLENIKLTKINSITSGKIYQAVIQKERAGKYLGQTVQIVPHITNEILERIRSISEGSDLCFIELGGTVGEMEGLPFVEALRQLKYEEKNVCFINVTMLIYTGKEHEEKTKPLQQGVATLRTYGIPPDILVVRCEDYLDESTKNKISIHCGISKNRIFSNIAVPNIYYVPLVFEKLEICQEIARILDFPYTMPPADLSMYHEVNDFYKTKNQRETKKIVIAGKYHGQDTYLSIMRAIEHAAVKLKKFNIKIEYLNVEDPFDPENPIVKDADAFIIPGGFGSRGIEGKLKVAQYTREKGIPCLGICLGMQVMVVEVCRNILGWTDATSEEWAPRRRREKNNTSFERTNRD